MEKTKEQRREELRAWTSTEIAAALARHNPFSGVRPTEVERNREGHIDSLLAWEGWK